MIRQGDQGGEPPYTNGWGGNMGASMIRQGDHKAERATTRDRPYHGRSG
jgi:hypothetical protein